MACVYKKESVKRKIERLLYSFLNLGADFKKNLSLLVSACGKLLKADVCLYNRLEKGFLSTVSGWRLPPYFKRKEPAEGHLCYDVIQNATSDKIYMVKNLPRSIYFRTDPNVKRYGLKTYVGFPVSYTGKNQGSLCVVYRKNVDLTEDDILIMKFIATLISIEEQRRIINENLRKEMEFEALVRRLYQYFINLSSTRLNKVINEALKEIGEFCRVDRSYIFLAYEHDRKVRNAYEWCAEGVEPLLQKLQDLKVKDFDWFAQKIINKEIVCISDVNQLPSEAKSLKELLKSQKVLSLLCVPLVYLGKAIGFLGFDGVKGPRQWTDTDIATLEVASEIFVSSIMQKKLYQKLVRTNIRLKELALKDYLTGLYNQSYFQEVMEREFQRTKRQGLNLSVLMVDLDYFKSINETYGFYFGDLILRQLAKKLKTLVRKYDIVVRYSGEEFVIIATGITRAEALSLAQRILERINLTTFGNQQRKIKIKLSIAVVAYPDDPIHRTEDFVELLEKILMKAKERGGGIVLSFLDIQKEKKLYFPMFSSRNIDNLKQSVERLTKKTHQSFMEAIYAFARTIEAKDQYTGEHGEKTVYYAVEIAKRLSLPEQEIEYIRQAAILHDLGKIGISEKILLKKDRLSHREFLQIKDHPRIGVEILRPVHFLSPVIPIILSHHERWDGKGYPHGLKREEIPVGARILAVADVFQALISDRPYRKAYSFQEAVEIIKKNRATHFDPSVVEAFLEVLKHNSK
ncbi:MAG: diguanylate cyclase [Candidatus Omnitrophica bacterium]|nr:diguanylate cyclase [Candidatus Omnitrophota bacterium]